ncbi:circularly permuted type 2 ATP-grasp protein [Actomonas aquatica]|uniref:Circularly permuted type 2 ATP-grasp protein n=1 Tax=Actomonas aquatica TaxID=2866162 RepID=A0ABZ1C6Y0_9BACT|nr:circularly permuted type 2 ATP-grasp protein [Opitutus sp. WL0086]WRQ87023.1 circularly permuted type 2 ATP-grasp protein [Opitutus sp. WL0086]
MSPRSRTLPYPSPAQLRALRNRLKLSVRDAGLTDLFPSDRDADRAFWELEPTPLIIQPDEWKVLEAAIQQRARLINTFLADLYHEQRALKEELVPPEITLADPYFRRPSHGLQPERTSPATLIRFDLVKTANGWHFTDVHTNAPVGLSYAVQNRRFLTQEVGDFYRALPDYRSVINFPLKLVDTLRSLAPAGRTRPSMVFLSAGPRYPFYSEHSFLARKMGLRLAQGDDLLVLDNHVYFKTVAGLERVDVIYRRLNDAYIDPVVFSTDFESAGIPGLMQCIRAGNVVVANAIGAGVAENRALNAYWPRLARYYFGERLLLPSAPTYICSDTDQIDAIIDQAESLHLKPTHSPRFGQPDRAPLRIKDNALPRLLREQPHAWVAQPTLESVPLPHAAKRNTPFRFSAFTLARGNDIAVLPGGIINIGRGPYPRDSVGPCADVIVLTGDAETAGSLSDFETNVVIDAESTLPSSRAAESLFWLGRYLERAESTARMLHILDDVALEEISASDRRRWLPLWRGLLEATGHSDLKINARTNPTATFTDDLLWRMTLGRNHPSSLINSVTAAAHNARQLRDYVSPEAGSVLTRLDETLRELAAQPDTTGRSRRARSQRARAAGQAITAVLDEVNACLGAASRTMLHDVGWHFLQIGQQLERAHVTTSTLRHVLVAAADSLNDEPSLDSHLHYRDNPELSALLRMLGSQDAYRRLFRTRSQPLFVAKLFLQQPEAPRSILHNLSQIRASLAYIRSVTDQSEETAPETLLGAILDQLREFDLSRHFAAASEDDETAPPPTAKRDTSAASLRTAIDTTTERLLDFDQLLSDRYFSHQARLATDSHQIELAFDAERSRSHSTPTEQD